MPDLQPLPLIFADLLEEVNFWALVSILSFGSGWHEVKVESHGSKLSEGVPHRDTVLHMLIALTLY